MQICKKRTVKRSDSLTFRASSKSDKSGSGKAGKKSYRHVDTVSLGAVKSFFEFDETENGMKDAIWIRTSDLTSDGRSFKQYPFVLTSEREKFVAEFRKNYYRQRPNGEIIVSCGRTGCAVLIFIPIPFAFAMQKGKPNDMDFQYAETLASSLSKSG